ncbi:histidine kinase [Streptomyces sp. NPDC005805]|uniref:sensor histidine kinase n=1 Tax=Streptomyces sp. NPDC005805 TaxID=3157068 RepID=UPI0034013E7A
MRLGALRGTTPPPGSRVALGALVVLVVGSLWLTALDMADSPLGRRTMVTGLTVLVLMPAVLLGQYAPPPYRLPQRWRWALLLVQAALTYLPLVLFRYPWLSLLGFLAGAVLLILPPTTSIPLALAVGASGPVLVHSGVIDTTRGPTSVLLSTAITASTVFAVAHLALLSARLHGSREQAARLAEQRTLARIRQDLHDLVGSSLAAIAVQGEAALRPGAPPEAARAALAEAVDLARRTQDDVRRISGPQSGVRLDEEFAHAQRLLTASGIAVSTALPARVEPDRAVTDCLRSVLREAVGNVLQHSRAGHCAIELSTGEGEVRLTVRNDGAIAVPSGVPEGGGGGTSGAGGGRRGTGIAGLRGRVIALGGTLRTGHAEREFTLTAALPLG